MQKIYRTSVIPAPIDEVWSVVGDFAAMADWHPVVRETRVNEGDDPGTVGAVRNCALEDGSALVERLTGLSNEDYRMSYDFLEIDMPMSDVSSEMVLHRVVDTDQTFIEWRMQFKPEAGSEDMLDEALSGILQAGFDSLKQRYAG